MIQNLFDLYEIVINWIYFTKNKNKHEVNRQQMQRIQQARKQSTLASFSLPPQGQALDVIKR